MNSYTCMWRQSFHFLLKIEHIHKLYPKGIILCKTYESFELSLLRCFRFTTSRFYVFNVDYIKNNPKVSFKSYFMITCCSRIEQGR
jgi:hypothetical protein